jgi:hypothetical protein
MAAEQDTKEHYASQASEIERQQSWHVDRTIPLVLIFGIFIQTAGAFWWASSQTEINRAQDDKLMVLTETLTRLTENLADRNERLAKLEAIGAMVNQKVDVLVDKIQGSKMGGGG